MPFYIPYLETIKSKVCFRNGDNENRIIFLTKK